MSSKKRGRNASGILSEVFAEELQRDEEHEEEDQKGGKLRRREEPQRETDPAVLDRRQKQIDYGKNTVGYDNYVRQVPKDKRSRDQPKTPDKSYKYSRRGFDGLIRIWRQKLHEYDPQHKKGKKDDDDDDDDDDDNQNENDEEDSDEKDSLKIYY